MPSFAQEVKEELIHYTNGTMCCKRSQLNAMLSVRGKINEIGNRIDFVSTNAGVSRKVFTLMKALYAEAKLEVAMIQNRRFRFRTNYIVRIFLDSQTKELVEGMKLHKMPTQTCCKYAYFRGWFLAGGTINRPEYDYRLDIYALEEEGKAKVIKKTLKSEDLQARMFLRKGKYVIYLKDFETICDFLYIINARRAVERVEAAQNLKEVKANVNRVVNCETANLQKTVNATQQQMQDMKLLIQKGVILNEKLKEVVIARRKFPDLNINELARKIYISPSGLKHRLQKIHLLANQVREERNSSKGKP